MHQKMVLRLFVCTCVVSISILIEQASTSPRINEHQSSASTEVSKQEHKLIYVHNDEKYVEYSRGRMFGVNTGDSATDFEAGMWLMALLGTLAAAVPVAFLSPNLGFKKRSADEKYHINNLLKNQN